MRLGAARVQHGNDANPSGRNLKKCEGGVPRHSADGQGELAYDGGAGDTGEFVVDAAAAVLAGIEPDGTGLAATEKDKIVQFLFQKL